jgi:nicotinamidase-related amidase
MNSGGNTKIREPAPGGTALLIIDMINELDFNGSQPLRDSAQKAVHAIVKLRDAADQARVPVVYVNDNNDQWHSDRERLIEEAFGSGQVTDDIVARLRPRDDDFFVIKPQFSGFYATNLQVLLPRLKASRLILTGVAADICVLFTAADAHMRDYELWVPEDGVASLATKRTAWALDIMKETMGAETRSTADLTMADWVAAQNG